MELSGAQWVFKRHLQTGRVKMVQGSLGSQQSGGEIRALGGCMFSSTPHGTHTLVPGEVGLTGPWKFPAPTIQVTGAAVGSWHFNITRQTPRLASETKAENRTLVKKLPDSSSP